MVLVAVVTQEAVEHRLGFQQLQACRFGVLDGLLARDACFLQARRAENSNLELEILKLAFRKQWSSSNRARAGKVACCLSAFADTLLEIFHKHAARARNRMLVIGTLLVCNFYSCLFCHH